jgi:type II secretory pathway pseudopilin PulG
MKKQNGMSLSELLVLMVVLAVAIALAVGGLFEAKRTRESIEAQRVLHSIARAQHVFKVQGEADADKDGVGEYGTLADLCHSTLLGQPYLDMNLFVELEDGKFKRRGYSFSLELGYNGDTIDDREKYWRAKAEPDNKGSQTYVIDPLGNLEVKDP